MNIIKSSHENLRQRLMRNRVSNLAGALVTHITAEVALLFVTILFPLRKWDPENVNYFILFSWTLAQPTKNKNIFLIRTSPLAFMH